ncbi:MAG: SlyX protein [Alphaproteobacteria bacterium HGW-Alphaproteobacteria-12]|nr:MAG: SlyX protein [Alphaproteobacteria bacterium HGW-Alphaproteobacteria-12]
MTNDRTPDARIDELEIRLAHQDRIIEELNEALARQWRTIDELTRKLGALGGRVQIIEEDAKASSPSTEPPPPHY